MPCNDYGLFPFNFSLFAIVIIIPAESFGFLLGIIVIPKSIAIVDIAPLIALGCKFLKL